MTEDVPLQQSRYLAVTHASVALLAAVLTGCGASEPEDPAAAAGRLEPLSVTADSVTVSGVSAGGYMAVQFHVAHSSLVRGAGVFAAGPYDCAGNSLANALGRCMQGGDEIPTAQLVAHTSQLALDDEIDPIAGLADDRVFIYRGGGDTLVARPVVDALETYYATLAAPAGIARVELANAGHTFPTDDPDQGPCDELQPPFIGSCGFDGARRMLEHLYGPFAPPAAGSPADQGELRVVDQEPYSRTSGARGLAPLGWLYVPAGCAGDTEAGRCRLHVVFHGCKQGASYVDDSFVRHAGYLEAADAGRIVMLFPQVERSFQPLNPNGCWDWWGYEGDAYAVRRGPQLAAVKAMVDDLIGAAVGSR